MSKSLIIGIVIAILAVIGVGAYLITKDSSNDTVATTTQNETMSDSPDFSPLATSGLAFEATFTSTTADGTINAGVIEVDGLGNSKYTGENSGTSYAVYTIDSQYISCSNDTCIKIDTPDTTAIINLDSYEYSQEQFNQFKQNASYKGTGDCSAGTCDIWEVSSENATISTLYIGSDNRIYMLATSNEDGKLEITYVYKDVKIVAPENVTEIPVQ